MFTLASIHARGEERSFWVPDASVSSCFDCDAPFSLLLRRHHCRVCGRVFCARCTAQCLRREGVQQRSCGSCFQVHSAPLAVAEPAEPATPEPPPAALGVGALLRRGGAGASAALAFTAAALRELGGDVLPPATTPPPPAPPEAEGVHALHGAPPAGEGPAEEEEEGDAAGPRFRSDAARLLGGDDEACADVEDEDERSSPVDGAARFRGEGEAEEEPSLTRFPDSPALTAAESVPLHPLARDDGDGEAIERAEGCGDGGAWAEVLARDDAGGADGEGADGPAWRAAVAAARASEAALEAGLPGSPWAPPPPCGPEADAPGCVAALRRALSDTAASHLVSLCGCALAAAAVPHAADWAPLLASLAHAAACAVDPACGGPGAGTDPRACVCVKRLPGLGARSDSRLVRGVATRRSVAHRRMPTHGEAPRLLLLGGSLQYARVEARVHGGRTAARGRFTPPTSPIRLSRAG